MKQHKWHKEIKAWADGAVIQTDISEVKEEPIWIDVHSPAWDINDEYRIKPKSKNTKYLYVWNVFNKIVLTQDTNGVVIDTWDPKVLPKYLGKIKIEVEDD